MARCVECGDELEERAGPGRPAELCEVCKGIVKRRHSHAYYVRVTRDSKPRRGHDDIIDTILEVLAG